MKKPRYNPREDLFFWIRDAGLPLPDQEIMFHPTRQWRFDFAWPDKKIAVEYEGGVWTGGAHVRGKHYESDCEKYTEAAIHGWLVIRVTNKMLKDSTAIELIKKAFEARASTPASKKPRTRKT